MKHLILLLLIPALLLAKPLKVLVIDTGTDLTHPEIKSHVKPQNWNKPDYIDENNHGTHISGIILKNLCKQVELISCNYFLDYDYNLTNSLNCFKKALTIKPTLINFSSSGYGYSKKEHDLLKQISDMGIKIVIAAGNDSLNLLDPINEIYPAEYEGIKNLIIVGNLYSKTSNYGLKTMVWENGNNILSTFPNGKWGTMSGSSQAAAIRSNKILKELCNEND